MNHAEIIKRFSNINCARLGDGYAPHKPILILLVLQKILMGHENKFSFSELDHDLKKRLEKYGSDNASNTRNEPFWRLKNDGVWLIEAPAELLALENTPTPNQLTQGNVSGSFIDEIYQELRRDPELIGDVANAVVNRFISEPLRVSLLFDAAPDIKLLERNYWWVSQNQTYQQEVPGNFMWSPKTNRDGSSNASYNYMKEMRVGDVVFSFAGTYIKAIGVVTKNATSCINPFGTTGNNWLNDGWLVDVAFEELKHAAFKPSDHMDVIAPTLPAIYSPIRPNGVGNQMYLASIPKEMAELLLAFSGVVGQMAVDSLSDNLECELPEDEHEEEIEVQMRTDIGETQKTQIINSRRGQGVFKARLRLVEKSCRITNVSNPRHLIASHIKPWAKSNDTEKLSGFNGLLLSPHIDHLFDKGYISFTDNGALIFSERLNVILLDEWGIDRNINVGGFKQEQKVFLEYHRDVVLV